LENPGRGLVAALNYGLSQARAPLVARMDADDRMHPERLQLQADYLARHPGIALVGSKVRLFPERRIAAGYREYARWQNRCVESDDIADEIYVESPLAHPSVMFRRSIVLAAGAYRHGDFPEDYEMWLRLHHLGHRMAKVPRVLLGWREREDRTSRVDNRYRRDAFNRLRADYLARDARLQQPRPLVMWGAGRKTRQRSNLLIDRGFHPQAWIDIDPRKIGRPLHGVPVMPPDWLERRDRPFVLCYVTNHGARELIAGQLHAMGYNRGRDYLMVG
jgi:glycosyltransferase involved in cell wall biosynthesis